MRYRRNPELIQMESSSTEDRDFLRSTQVKHLREGVMFDIELMTRSPQVFHGPRYKPSNNAVWTSTLRPMAEVSPFSFDEWDDDDPDRPQWMTTSWAQDADYFSAYGEDAALFSIDPWAKVFHIRTVEDQIRLIREYGKIMPGVLFSESFDWDQMRMDGWDGVHLARDYPINFMDAPHRPKEVMGIKLINLWSQGWDAESTAWLNPSALIFKGLARVDSKGAVSVRNPSRLSRLYGRAWKKAHKV